MRAHRFKLTLAARRVAVQAASRPSIPAFRDGVKRTADSGAGTVSDWIVEIRQVWSRGTGNAMELARLIGKARNRLLHGEWTQVVKSLPFSKRKADMLATIGKRLAWLNEQTCAHLPIGWNILYQLAQLERAVFEKLLKEETIHPKLTLREAKELVARFNGRRRRKNSAGINVKRRLHQFSDFVERTLDRWKASDRKRTKKELNGLIELIGKTSAKAATQAFDATLKDGVSYPISTVTPKSVHQTQGGL